MKIGLAVLVMMALTGMVLLGAIAAGGFSRPAPAGLHSVWCVKQGYPASLAWPQVVGPGTGLTGCPLGEVQVQQP